MSKLKDRLESVSPDIRENFKKFEGFIELIEAIGFREKQYFPEFILYTYNGYNITIVPSDDTRWSMSITMPKSSDGKYRPNDFWLYLGNNQRNFSLDEISLLEKHFKSELRDLRLKELLN